MAGITAAPCPPLTGSSNPSSRSSLLDGCLALKLAASLPLSKSSHNSRDLTSTSSLFGKPSSRSCATSTKTSTSFDDCVVGPFCPLFSSRNSLGNFSRKKLCTPLHIQSFNEHVSISTHGGQLSLTALSLGRPTIPVASSNFNGAPLLMDEQARIGEVVRTTKETDVKVTINLDGSGICNCDTGIPFLDHMLDQLASHGLFDLNVMAKGDLHIDDHHTNEDVALALGTALLQALGDRKGIHRFGDFSAPLDEALVHVVLDLSGRPYLAYDMIIPTERVGTYDTQLVEHFFQSLANTSGMTLHIRQLSGKNSHHIIEASFKAFARALRKATEYDERRKGSIPSSKGVLSRA